MYLEIYFGPLIAGMQGLVLINFRALKTLTASVIYQEFIFKKKTQNLPPLKEMKFPRFYICVYIYMYNMYV